MPWTAEIKPLVTREKMMKNLFNRFVRDEQGQDLIEYALLAGFISLVAVAAITAVGTGLKDVYEDLNTQVDSIPG
jgi:pilus assembly protein Flp/PilA